MRINLGKFRQYEDFSLEVPDVGLVRLAGDSGAGKSTVVSAIAWALFGANATRNVSPMGGKGGLVELDAFGLNVVRMKNPERIEVAGRCSEEAQAYIETTLGMSWEQFKASSWIQQKMQGSLLSLAPAEQLRFVQKLAFGSDDPEKYRATVYAEMKSAGESCDIAKAALSGLESQHQDYLAKLANKPSRSRSEIEARVATLSSDLSSHKDTIRSAEANLKHMNGLRLEQTKLLSHPLRTAPALRDKCQAELDDLLAQQQELTATQPEAIPDTEALRQKYSKLQSQLDFLQRAAALDLIATTAEEFSTAKQDAIDSLEAKVRAASDVASAKTAEAALLDKSITQAQLALKSLVCPHCNGSVRVVNERLQAADQPVDPSVLARLKKMRLDIEQEMRANATELAKDTKHMEALRALGEPPVATVMSADKVRSLMVAVDTKLKDSSAIIAANAARDAKIRDLNSRIAAQREKIAKLDLQIDEAEQLPSIKDVEASLAEIACTIDEIEELIKGNKLEIEVVQASIDAERRALEQVSAYEAIEASYATLLHKMAERQTVVTKAQTRYDAAVRLKALSDMAATDAVAAILDAINANAKMYLDLLFPEQGTSVQILNEKENKDGSKAAKLSVQIVHKGIQYSSVDDLSGGESSRLQLAVQMAVASLFNSPILILDEAFAGTHPELRDDGIVALRQIADKQLVLVIEHGVSNALFDSVLTF